MDTVPLFMYIILGVLFLLSAFFSSSETAYSSLNKIRLQHYVDEKRRGSKKAYYISENFDEALSTILIGNNIVNIAAETISANIASTLLDGNKAMFVSTFVTTLLVLIFGEVTPKSYAKENAEKLAMHFSGVLFFLMKCFAPFNYIILKLKSFITNLSTKEDQEPSVTEEELKVLVNISEQEGVIDDKERTLVHRALDFNEITADEVLTPRIDMVAIDIEQDIEEIKNIFFENKFSRLPVYQNSTDNIVGILSERDFFSKVIKSEEKNFNIRPLLSEPLFVVSTIKLSTLLPEFQMKKTHMAIVIDEYSGTKGLITMEDVLEELVGDIWDEDDEQTIEMVKLNDTHYEFNGNYSIDEFCDYFKIKRIEVSSHSLGGWMIEELERIPDENDTIQYECLTLTASEVVDRRIQKIRVSVDNTKEKEEEHLS